MNSPLTKQQKLYAALFCIFLGITIFSCILALCFMRRSQSETSVASIYQNGALIDTISLSDVASPYQLRVEGANGSYNIIEVRPGAIGVTDANCPDHICVRQGFHSSSALPITCLPNRLVIVFSPQAEETSDFDMTTY